MADLLQRSIGPAVQIETHFPLRLAPALADANQLELAILNLVLNARDAMPGGGVIGSAAKERAIGLWERWYVAELLRHTGGNLSEAARVAHSDRSHLRKLVLKHLRSAITPP